MSYYAASKRRISLCQLAMSLSPFGNAINENKWNPNRRGRGREEEGGGGGENWGLGRTAWSAVVIDEASVEAHHLSSGTLASIA